MILAWRLLLIIPMAGMILAGLCMISGQQHDCAECQYNCLKCPLKKEKSEQRLLFDFL